ncbi:AraC family transcriptional regulator [Arenibaculum sp.]|jgi:AraC-like DNA-binding protein|uniref:helix-turn-helix transcriptional regulator n=1 Tax=Arenibaculum sp. TaxID=2865862 RepID=UPI002E0FD708|nr:AraC family transcriptional regulator [Arenibaculum sp.]
MRDATGIGQIHLWRGGSLWIGRSGKPADFHQHHAIQICLPLEPDQSVAFAGYEGVWRHFRAALIPSHHRHAFDGRGAEVAMIFTEPESVLGRAILARYGTEAIADLEAGAAGGPAALELRRLWSGRAGGSSLIAAAQAVLTSLAGENAPRSLGVDPRVVRSIAWLRGRLDGPVTLIEAAAAVRLSPGRYRHLFVAETGLPFRAFVLWLRMERALLIVADGGSLTDAAHAGGFADQAHMSRTFRSMFGITPSSFIRL